MTTAVITGGASGIGAAVADSLVRDGTTCIIADRNVPATPLPGVRYVHCDLSTDAGVADLVRAVDEHGGHVDHLVECAAILHTSAFLETERLDWERVLQVNLHSPIAVTQALVPRMGEGGRILFFASGTVFKGPPNLFAYVTSKAGIIGLARCLAEELGAQGITVNVVSPGITATPMIDIVSETEEANIATRAIKRRAFAADIVGPVRFLLSDAARFVTGQTLCVDGGSVKH